MIAKFFSIEDANDLIPELINIVKKLRKKKEEAGFIEYQVSLIKLTKKLKIEYEEDKELSKNKKELNNIVADLNLTIKKIHDLGCFLQDVEQGVIDFLSEKDGRPIFLSWRPGEDEISYYHEIDSNFNERKYLWFD